ncbi:MAG: peptidoglycan -binding protein, partial [Alphaproteobacteria bacterium]
SELSQREQDLTGQIAAERARIAAAERNIAVLRAELDATIARRNVLDHERQALQNRLAATERDKAAVEGQRAELDRRLGDLGRERLELLARIVGLEKDRGDLGGRVGALETEKRAAAVEKEKLTGDVANLEARLRALETQRRTEEQAKLRLADEKTTLEQRLAALEATRRADEDARTKLAAEKQGVEQRLAALERELDALRRERDRLQAALASSDKAVGDQKRLTDDQAAELALLNRQLDALRRQLAGIEAALKASESKSRTQNVEIEDLGRRLNAALASQVQELQRYRSEFFGRLREILGDRREIRVVGDRFIFQSEVLFPVGSDEINPAGREQMAKLARSLKEISEKIPTELNWVLRVDGHTDRRPIVSARFPSNWELSTARAIAVVKFLVAEGVPASRLVAAGFGEFQPLEPGESEEAYNRNRRIELKLTER